MSIKIEQFVRHAKRYGPAYIAESAVEEGATLAELTKLITALDKIEDDAAKAKLRNPKNWKKPRRRKAENRAKHMLGIEDEPEAVQTPNPTEVPSE